MIPQVKTSATGIVSVAGDREDDRPRDCPGEGGTVDGIVEHQRRRAAAVGDRPGALQVRDGHGETAEVELGSARHRRDLGRAGVDQIAEVPSPAFNAPALTLTLAPLFALPRGREPDDRPVLSPPRRSRAQRPRRESSRRGSASLEVLPVAAAIVRRRRRPPGLLRTDWPSSRTRSPKAPRRPRGVILPRSERGVVPDGERAAPRDHSVAGKGVGVVDRRRSDAVSFEAAVAGNGTGERQRSAVFENKRVVVGNLARGGDRAAGAERQFTARIDGGGAGIGVGALELDVAFHGQGQLPGDRSREIAVDERQRR